jgi:hypothetical protein
VNDYIYVGRNDYGEHPYTLHIQRGNLVAMFNMSEKDFVELQQKVLEASGAVEMQAEDLGLPPSANIDDIPF